MIFRKKKSEFFKSPFLSSKQAKRLSVYEQDIQPWPVWVGDNFPEFRVFTTLNDTTYWMDVREYGRRKKIYEITLVRVDANAYGPENLVREETDDFKDAVRRSHYLQTHLEDVLMEHLL